MNYPSILTRWAGAMFNQLKRIMEIYRGFEIAKCGENYRIIANGYMIGSAESKRAAKDYIDELIYED